MKTILFQGDSITDAGRNKEAEFDLGKGYPKIMVCIRSRINASDTYR